jgi:hypothetical protein
MKSSEFIIESAQRVGPVYHGTSGSFTNFNDATLGTSSGDPNTVLGHFFTSSKEEALMYGKNIIAAQLVLRNPYEATMDELVSLDEEDYRTMREELIEDGYDSIIALHDEGADVWYVVFSNTQIKIIQ